MQDKRMTLRVKKHKSKVLFHENLVRQRAQSIGRTVLVIDDGKVRYIQNDRLDLLRTFVV